MRAASIPSIQAPPPIPETLEGELSACARRLLGRRPGDIVASVLGWDGGGPKLLREVGLRFNLTRERVRQIRNHGLSEFARIANPPPLTQKAVDLLRRIGPATLPAAKAALLSESLCSEAFDPRGLVDVSAALNPAKRLSYSEFEGVGRIGCPAMLKTAADLLSRARRDVRRNGLADVDALLRAAPGFDKKRLVELLAAHHDAALSPSERWVALADLESTRLHARLDKMLSVCPGLRAEEFRERALAEPRMSGVRLPMDAAEFFLSQSKRGRLEGGWFEADPALRRPMREVLSDAERTMVAVLRSAGEVLTIDPLEKACLAAGMNRNTFRLYLSWSPVMKRLSKGTYTLVGSSPAKVAERVAKLSCAGGRSKALMEHGREGEAEWFAVYRVTASSLANGVLSLPAELRPHLDGCFRAVGIDGSEIGECRLSRICISGLRRAFKRLSVEADGILRMSFLPSERKVILRLEPADEGAAA